MASIIPRFASIMALIGLGLTMSVAHHLSYRFLSGKSTSEYPQTAVKASALTMAFLVKSSFATAIGMAFQETAWKAVRSKEPNVTTLDKIFTSQSNLLSLLHRDALKVAPAALILSALRWGVPFAAILPPGTLDVRIATHETINTTCHVPTFNNTLGRTWFPGGMGIKVMATPDLDKWTYQTVVSNRTAFIPSDTFCGANCSYTQTFVAPHMECRYTDVDVRESHDIARPKNSSDDYNQCELSSADACYLWGSAAINDSADDGPRNLFNITYAQSWQEIDKYHLYMNYTRITCGYTQAYYTLSIRYINNLPDYNITTLPFEFPSDFHPDYYREPTTNEELWDLEVTARGLFHYFQSVWISGKFQLYRYPNAHDDLRIITRTQAALTPLIEIKDNTIQPTHDLTQLIPELFRNHTISTFLLNPSHTNITTCTIANTTPLYRYEPTGLLLSYGIAAVISIGSALWGLAALRANDEPTRPMFEQFVSIYGNKSYDMMGMNEMMHQLPNETDKELRYRELTRES